MLLLSSPGRTWANRNRSLSGFLKIPNLWHHKNMHALQSNSTKNVVDFARSLFIRGMRLGEAFESKLKDSIVDFYYEAVPWAKEVYANKPWKTAYYGHHQKSTESKSFLAFLRNSLQGGENTETYKAAYNHAAIIWMIIVDDLVLDDILKIHYSYLLKLAHTVDKLDKFSRARLLESAASSGNFREFKAKVETELEGVHVEPNQVRVFSGQASEIKRLDEFKEVTEAMGDKRPELEKISEAISAVMYTEQDFPQFLWSARAISAWVNYMRRREPGLEGLTDNQILGEWVYNAMEISSKMHDLDAEAEADFIALTESRPTYSVQDQIKEDEHGTNQFSDSAERASQT